MNVNTDQLIRDMAELLKGTRQRTPEAKAARESIEMRLAELFRCRVKKIAISCRKWRDKTYGNTYYSVYVSYLMHGEENWEGFKATGYGYGSTFEHESKRMLTERGIFDGLESKYENAGMRLMCHDLNIEYEVQEEHVSRKRDLHQL